MQAAETDNLRRRYTWVLLMTFSVGDVVQYRGSRWAVWLKRRVLSPPERMWRIRRKDIRGRSISHIAGDGGLVFVERRTYTAGQKVRRRLGL
jgi:hypothetical protein